MIYMYYIIKSMKFIPGTSKLKLNLLIDEKILCQKLKKMCYQSPQKDEKNFVKFLYVALHVHVFVSMVKNER